MKKIDSCEYEINNGTLCLIRESENITRVVEKDKEFFVDGNIKKIVDNSCKSFGSSLEGRMAGTTKLTGIRYKTPIVVSEYLFIVLFPTASPNNSNCNWISLHNIKNYDKSGGSTIVEFTNGKKIKIKESYFIMQNQISKAVRLEYSLRRTYKNESE